MFFLNIILIFISLKIVFCNKPVVIFSGASITAQGINGYVHFFRRLYPNWQIETIAFPGASIHPCLCATDEIYKNKPIIHFFEWSIRNGPILNEMEGHVTASVWKAISHNTIPVFLHMPYLGFNGTEIKVVNIINNLSQKLNFSVIDLKTFFTLEELKNGLLRDDCHTTVIGAQRYASAIKQYLDSHELKIPKKFEMTQKDFDFKIVKFNQTATKHINMKLFGHLKLINIKKGPYSNRIEIRKNGTFFSKFNFWDEYCHYERDAVVNINIKTDEITDISLKLLNENFDRSKLRRNITFSQDELKHKLTLNEICVSGNVAVEFDN